MVKRKKSKDTGPAKFSGRGVMFTVYDHSRDYFPGVRSTPAIIAKAIEEALDAGYDDPTTIARYLVTTTFPHTTDRVAKFNSVLKAGDVVGANITTKLFNGYADLRKMARNAEDVGAQTYFEAEARGFAEAITIILSPFSVEHEDNRKEIDWDEVDHLTDLMEEQQEEARKAK